MFDSVLMGECVPEPAPQWGPSSQGRCVEMGARIELPDEGPPPMQNHGDSRLMGMDYTMPMAQRHQVKSCCFGGRACNAFREHSVGRSQRPPASTPNESSRVGLCRSKVEGASDSGEPGPGRNSARARIDVPSGVFSPLSASYGAASIAEVRTCCCSIRYQPHPHWRGSIYWRAMAGP